MAKQYGILVDITHCLGCGVCVATCKQENDLPPYADDKPGTTGTAWNQVLSFSEGVYPDLAVHYLHIHCMHCENPPCVAACPKDAIHKREEGTVLITKAKCNGCQDQPDKIKKCVVACPYGAIQVNEVKGTVEACTLCVHRTESGLEPACVRACIGGALIFGDLGDPHSKIAEAIMAAKDRVFILKPEENTGPSVRYICPEGASMEKVSDTNTYEVLYGFRKP